MHRLAHRCTALILCFALSINTAFAGRWFRSACEPAPSCEPTMTWSSSCSSGCVETVVYASGCEAPCGAVVDECGCGDCGHNDCHSDCGGCESECADCGESAAPMPSHELHHETMEPTPAPPIPTQVESAPEAPAQEMVAPVDVAAPAPMADVFAEEPPVIDEPVFEEPVAEEPAAFNEPEEDLFAAEEEEAFPAEEPAMDDAFVLDEPMEEPVADDGDDLFGNEMADAGEDDLFGAEPVADPEAFDEPPAAEPADDLFGDDTGEGDLFGEPVDTPADEPMDAPEEDDLFGGFDDAVEDAAPMEEAVEEAPAEEAGDDFDDLFGGFGAILREPGGYDSSEMRTWVDNSGRFSCVARLLGVDGGSVRLLKQNGATSTVSLARLSGRDLEFVNRQALAQIEVGDVRMAQR